MEFEEFKKIPRYSRGIVITEKLDGTNAQIAISEDGEMKIGSRNRWITPQDDNYGFAKWCMTNKEELLKLGVGRHYGEWWGSGVQRGYGLKNGEKRFSLFNVGRWSHNPLPSCCFLVPVIHAGMFTDTIINEALEKLRDQGSFASPGFMKPEGLIIFHKASQTLFKKTLEKDDEPKSMQQDAA